ncbi:SPFH domain-containing protein [Brevundimonas sp.]|uniref:SPFH domain-containing protein n=1 Tax=Brevundimonas sp. TaxID=1871086 RepID=UPI00289B3D2F|nr:SPFH domain-containing protein [Brevundimonas sp.]
MSPTVLIILALLALVVVGVALAFRFRMTVVVPDWQRAGVYLDGGFERILGPGRHRLWRSSRTFIARIEMTPQYLSVGPVDVVTSDRLPLRLEATALHQIEDAEASLREPTAAALQLATSTALVRLAAERTLEQLLTRDPELDAALTAAVGPTVGATQVLNIVLTGVILPPELRRLMSDVERSRLEGQAALERARSEQASLRALSNAARLLKDNPELARLRLFQAAASARSATFVVGDSALSATPAHAARDPA